MDKTERLERSASGNAPANAESLDCMGKFLRSEYARFMILHGASLQGSR
jgi:hypothetical protein